ncbi:hypothetical protein [Paucibacter sp. Y2R2-4]|uniref:hypothetical protein n=1 Tax=Paucibacter sp. Y2R2-4 TaxID=2893553 RepID=UPI0021E4B6E7|nr:hypothetical protein [Paucibacter sp. Y2R2-4]MCV2349087.1 hypothetical protein [Paucibacter sp. Y2R2-4]
MIDESKMPDMSPNAGLPRIFAVLAWAALLGGASQALAADAAQATVQESQMELQQLGQQRAEIEARFKAESLLCEERFAVNDCLNRVRAERSLALKPITSREQEIDKLERRARAEAQRQRVIEREQEAAKLEAQRRMSELLAAQREALRQSEPAGVAPSNASAGVVKPRPSVQELEQAQRAKKLRADQEAERRLAQRQAFERQQAAHQREAQQRMAQREAQSKGKKAAASLPIPSAAEIAAASQSAASAGKR